jgi:hypothetical protein
VVKAIGVSEVSYHRWRKEYDDQLVTETLATPAASPPYPSTGSLVGVLLPTTG